ncbi:MAG: NHLP leader peptide family natural product precursor [Chlamydiales bacterium]|nr:NHLP leader peptide family natural product precursor [Chlamydiales bacterium]
MDDPAKTAKLWGTLIRRIWDNPALKEELKRDPHKFLKESGLELSTSQAIEIHENTPQTLHLILPEKPKRELSDEILAHIITG